MKQQKWLRATAIIMSTLLLMTGCGDSAKGSEASGSGQSTSAKEESSKAESSQTSEVKVEDSNFNAEGLPILKEKETFTIAYSAPKLSKKATAQKQCVIDTEAATNVHIEWIEIPSDGWKEKINLMFSTGDLPDVIMGDVSVAKYIDQLVSLEEYINEYAPNMTAYFETTDDLPDALRAFDGNIYGLPRGEQNLLNSIDSRLWINQKWLDTLGLEMPETTEELKEVLIAFRDKDPNGNGKADEIPFIFESVWGYGTSIENFFGSFGVLENGSHVTTVDGKVTFSPQEDGYYNTLVYLNDLYQEGLIDKDIFTLSADQYAAKASSGGADDILGLVAGYAPANIGVVNQDDYTMLPLITDGSGEKMVLRNGDLNATFFITKSCEKPEVIVRWYDYINSSVDIAMSWSRGEKGVGWQVVEENGQELIQVGSIPKETLQSLGYASVAEYRQSESLAGQSIGWVNFSYPMKQSGIGAVTLPIIKEMLEYGVEGLPQGVASEENSERRSILIADIDNYLEKFVANSVINGIDEAKWEEHLKALKDLKADEYTALCQEYVDSVTK